MGEDDKLLNVIEKAIEIARANIEIEDDMNEVADDLKEEVSYTLVNDEEIREKALKKVIGNNDL